MNNYNELSSYSNDELRKLLEDDRALRNLDFYVLLPTGCLGISTLAPYEIHSGMVCIMPEGDKAAGDYLTSISPGYSKLTNTFLGVVGHSERDLAYRILGKLLMHRIKGNDAGKLKFQLNLIEFGFDKDEVIHPVLHASESRFGNNITRSYTTAANLLSPVPEADMYCDLVLFEQEDIFVHDKRSSLSSEQLNTKTENKMLQLILGMAMEAYGYDPYSADRQDATGENKNSIQARLSKMGISISNDTIKRYLDKAVEDGLCPAKPMKKK